jgi:UDP:flavonoid glycosyltransferase YjiC (YdhE family)
MRVLVVSAPLAGHLRPMLPLVQAVRDRDHEVLVATGGDACTPDLDIPVEDVVPGFRFGRVASGMMLRHPMIARAELRTTAAEVRDEMAAMPAPKDVAKRLEQLPVA